MLIEQNTNYAYKLKYMSQPSFGKVRDLSVRFYRELPQALQDELYEALNRGIDILDSEPQMTAYLFSFGKMHQAKLKYAFNHLPAEFLSQPEINIVDYGCGQALGTMCYADFLHKKGYLQKVKTVTLIEPSECCLKRAALHTSVFFPKAEIRTIHKTFDKLCEGDIYCDEDAPTLHILSNVLDMLIFDLERFSNLVKQSLKGYNQFVCVGPYFFDSARDKGMDVFLERMEGNEKFSETLGQYQLDPDREWTCKVKISSRGELVPHTFSAKVTEADLNEAVRDESGALSTKVTEADLNEAVRDEFGALYSRDGKRLLRANHIWFIKNGTEIICDSAFEHDSSLHQIIIPDSVTTIGDYAFSLCRSLLHIHLPQSVSYIGKNPFRYCERVVITSDSVKYTARDDSLIDNYNKIYVSYFGKERIFSIPDSVTSIGDYAFACCTSLLQIVIPDAVTSIGDYAFAWCKSLQQIHLPGSVSYIGKNPFQLCERVVITSDSVKYTAKGGSLIDNYNKRFVFYFGNERTFTIPDTVTSISDGAFRCCESLRQIVIPDSVISIGDEAFSGCKSLQHIVIPDSVTSIGKEAFIGCESLQQIIIPDSVTSIGEEAFRCCESLQHIVIPDTVTSISIGDYAFKDCESLQHIVIPDSVTSIGDKAFSGCKSLQQIVIPDTVTAIGSRVFEDCESLLQVAIPDSVTSIGDYAFAGCKSLQQVVIPDTITSIGDFAFIGCLSLQQIHLPQTVSYIGKNPFITCGKVVVTGDSVQYTARDDSLIDNYNKIFVSYFGKERIVSIPETVTSIGDYAFARCESLRQIVIPNSVTSIGKGAFRACCSLRQIVIPDSVTSIGDDAFIGCKSLRRIVIPVECADKYKKMIGVGEFCGVKLVEKKM